MWAVLQPGQDVQAGDLLRFTNFYSTLLNDDNLFEVVKTEQHYFEIITAQQKEKLKESFIGRKIIKYFDIGYHICLEIWKKDAYK